jgi:hypothetical protein
LFEPQSTPLHALSRLEMTEFALACGAPGADAAFFAGIPYSNDRGSSPQPKSGAVPNAVEYFRSASTCCFCATDNLMH